MQTQISILWQAIILKIIQSNYIMQCGYDSHLSIKNRSQKRNLLQKDTLYIKASAGRGESSTYNRCSVEGGCGRTGSGGRLLGAGVDHDAEDDEVKGH